MGDTSIDRIAQTQCFGGSLERYTHASACNDCGMTFSIFLPKTQRPLPVLYWLSGLTCNDENFMQKAGAQRIAAELGIVLVTPDTSPRGVHVPDDPEHAWDFGLGAGFYVNATESPWATNYQMFSYVSQELPKLIEQHFEVSTKKSISGHSMGGHGALVCALKNPREYASASAFAPIANPSQCPWGEKAFSQYLGEDRADWLSYDSCELLANTDNPPPLLVSQGSADNFLQEQLNFDALVASAQKNDYTLEAQLCTGYDHSYYFIASFIEQHMRFHAQHLSESK
ncbi:MAG: S-formylglutathione hydrolase [Alteromonadaceae bacterium]|nr:MAG: S-formylglutathione hydrolase [Alteromonadaceae bacterium]